MKLLYALRNSSKKIISELEDSKLFDNSGDIGKFREELIEQLLRPFLPDCYGLGTGEIFSIDGNSSKQIDIVIYDAVFSNVLFKNKSNQLFPCESVYGEIEIKTYLSSNELIRSLDNIESMKLLKREDSTMLDITPLKDFKIKIGGGLGYDNTKCNPYLGIIFGYDGLEANSIINILNNELQSRDKDLLPDFIFCFKKHYMILKVKDDNTVANLGGKFDKYSIIYTKEDTIPMMFITINTCLNSIRLKAPDYNKYWINLFNEIAHK